jgi:uncharacterized protein with PIN domain
VKFICDDNLGKLTKYLRILGFDTSFQENFEDNGLLRLADSEQRFLLTRDHNMLGRTHPYGLLLLEDDDPLLQLKTLIEKLSLKIDVGRLFIRCSRCNLICHEVDKSQIANEVFPYILRTQEIISQCPSCRRYYWKGTHYGRLLTKLKSVIPDAVIVGKWPASYYNLI